MPDSHPTLSDTLPLNRRINIFSSLLRDQPDISSLLSQPQPQKQQPPSPNKPSSNLTVLAPLNTALQSLPHKPWESPSDYSTHGPEAYSGEAGQARAQANLRSFAERHILLRGPGEWPMGDRVHTLAGGGEEGEEGGKKIWWEEREEEEGGEGETKQKVKVRVIMPDGVEVEGVEARAANGEVWLLKGVLGA